VTIVVPIIRGKVAFRRQCPDRWILPWFHMAWNGATGAFGSAYRLASVIAGRTLALDPPPSVPRIHGSPIIKKMRGYWTRFGGSRHPPELFKANLRSDGRGKAQIFHPAVIEKSASQACCSPQRPPTRPVPLMPAAWLSEPPKGAGRSC